MPRSADSGFDAAVADRENHSVALVQVKAQAATNGWAAMLLKQLSQFAERIDFVLTADLKSISVYRWVEGALTGPLVQLDTPRILQHYDPDFAKKRVFEPYLLTLVEAWLRDLAYHWKSENPPGAEELRRAGLLEKLEGGTTQPLGA